MKIALILLAATALATLAIFDNGQVSMVWQDWVIETSLTFALAAFLVSFFVVYALVRLLFNVMNFPQAFRRKQQLKQYEKAESLMAQGLLALEYGDWKKAEKQLIKTAQKSDSGLVHYLNAAKMAHNQQAYERRDQYLLEARKRFPAEYIMVGLVESRLVQQEQPETAQVILHELHTQMPRDRVVLAEYAHLLQAQKNWKMLETIIPKLKRTKALDKPEIYEMEIKIRVGELEATDDFVTLEWMWKNLDGKLKKHPLLLGEYIEKRLGWGEEIGIAAMIEAFLNRSWDDRLVYQYGRIHLGPAFERLKKAEPWLKKHPDSPVLLLTLGRLACMSQLWGQGQYFLKESLKRQPEVETFHALAQCYESEGEDEQAALVYKEAILKLEEKNQS